MSASKRIIIRTDASLLIGSGHVMRCLTLADGLRVKGAEVLFVCRDLPGNLNAMIADKGFDVCRLPEPKGDFARLDWNRHARWLGVDWQQDADETLCCLRKIASNIDWLVVDHYALDRQWQGLMRPLVGKIMVIDDLADREHDCDLLLDQNLGRTAGDYENFVSEKCKLLVGLEYVLLRPEFAGLRQSSLRRRALPQFKRLLISMGGVDKDNTTCQILEVLKNSDLPEDCRITVVMGSNAPWQDQVRDLAKKMPWVTEVRINVQEMARLMVDSDLAIGGAGSSSWERCVLGLPSLLMLLAENQREVAIELSVIRAAILLDEKNVKSSLTREVKKMVSNTNAMKDISIRAANLLDGYGTQRVIKYLEESL